MMPPAQNRAAGQAPPRSEKLKGSGSRQDNCRQQADRRNDQLSLCNGRRVCSITAIGDSCVIGTHWQLAYCGASTGNKAPQHIKCSRGRVGVDQEGGIATAAERLQADQCPSVQRTSVLAQRLQSSPPSKGPQ